MKFRLGELERLTGGTLNVGDPGMFCASFSTDTRSIRHGDIFVALNGKNFLGAEFVPAAIDAGACGIISDSPAPENLPDGVFHLRVENTTKALGEIGSAWRRKVNPRVITVVGSGGKTTTKEMTAHLCRNLQPTLATEGNLNNLIGVPLTLLKLTPADRLAVIEIGMNVYGELAELTRLIDPEFVVYTNITNAHIGNFGSVENLIKAKAEPLYAMRRDGTLLLSTDCPRVSALPANHPMPDRVYTYGENAKANFSALNVRKTQPFGYQFDLTAFGETAETHISLFGRYQVQNALAASAVANLLGMSVERIAESLADFHAPRMRAQTEWFDGIFIILDCYNASPDATIRTVQSLNEVSGLNRRFALLGDMLELGEMTEEYHRLVGSAVAAAHLDGLIAVGENARYTAMEAESHGVPCRHFAEAEDAAQFLSRELRANDGLVVKGSRGVRLENVLIRMKALRSEMRDGARVQEGLGTPAC